MSECTCGGRHSVWSGNPGGHSVVCPAYPLNAVDELRPSWDEYGVALARAASLRADCSRRKVGAVILAPDGRVISTGYNGAPAGELGCLSDGACPRGRLSVATPGLDYEESECVAIHAEMNAVIYAGRDRCAGATLYCTDAPCYLCLKVIKAAGIDRVVVA